MRPLLTLAALVAFSTAANSQSKNWTFYCTIEASGGLSYDETQKKWVGGRFRSNEAFILRMVFKRTSSEKMPGGKEELVNFYDATVTEKGTSNTKDCISANYAREVRLLSDNWFSCQVPLMEYEFNIPKGRFLQIYRIGFVNGQDNNNDTPAISGGTCTKID